MAAEVRSTESALTGAPISSIPALSQRNALVTQNFAPSLVTPDGRIGFRVVGDYQGEVIALADPVSQVSGGGVPRFASSMASHAVPIALPAQTAPNEMTSSTAIANAGSGGYGHHRVGQGEPLAPWRPSGAGALVLDPRYSPGGKPFPVTSPDDCRNATPATSEAFTNTHGQFECYRLLHFQPYSYAGVGAFPLFQGQMRVIVDARRPDHSTRVVGRSANPTIVEAVYTSPLQLAVSGSHQEGGRTILHFLHSLESSATADGRLFTAEMGIWSYNETPWRSDTWIEPRPIEDRTGHNGALVAGLYKSVNRHWNGAAVVEPAVPAIASICRQLPASGTTCLVEEESFARVYPVAAQPFYRTDGALATNLAVGYTWISPEGTDLFARINPDASAGGQRADGLAVREGFESSTGMQFFSMGQHTSWMVRRIDGGINTRRFDPEQLPPGCPNPGGCVSPGGFEDRPFSPIFLNTSSGFWAENRQTEAVSFPILRQPSVFQFMTQNNAINPMHAGQSRSRYQQLGLLPTAGTSVDSIMQYWEVSFACATSPTCLLHLPMNEYAYNLSIPGSLPTTRPETHDASNNTDFLGTNGWPLSSLHPYVGQLKGAARFIGEAYGLPDERYLSGFRGTGVSMGASGYVSVAVPAVDATSCSRNKGCLQSQSYPAGFTAELAFLPLFTAGSASVPLAVHHGLWDARLENRRVRVSVSYLTSGSPSTLVLTSPGTVSTSTFSAGANLQAQAWTHVAIRHDPKSGPVGSSGLSSRVTLFINGSPVASGVLPAGATLANGAPLASGPDSGQILRIGPASLCTGCPAGEVLFMDEVLIHKSPLRDEDIAASAGKLAARPGGFMTNPGEVRALLGSYFTATNPRSLALAADGFPVFLRETDLRVPVEFASYAAASNRPKFRQLVDLGATLFSSPVLSTGANGQSQVQLGTGQQMSCATCHLPHRAFTDGRATALGVQNFPINSPTLTNRALGTSQFLQRSSTSLVDLALRPIIEPREMNGNLTQVLQRINNAADQAALRQAFAAIFGTTPVTSSQVALALAAFQLVQLSVDSLADTIISTNKAMRDGAGVLLTPAEVKLGKNLFEGKARCTACHVGTNFSDELLHDTGVSAQPNAFKTPTLWNISETGPYFHDGSAGSLQAVLAFYNRGGNGLVRAGGGVRPVDPELRPLALTATELNALEMYLRALTNAGPLVQGLPVDTFSHNGLVPGLSCIPILESDTGWDDNYLCSGMDRGVRYSQAGNISGMTCYAMTEPAESAIWSDNVLCVPPGSLLEPQWSYTGPVSGKDCVNFNEPRDAAHAWSDNYFCFNPASLPTELIVPTLTRMGSN